MPEAPAFLEIFLKINYLNHLHVSRNSKSLPISQICFLKIVPISLDTQLQKKPQIGRFDEIQGGQYASL